MQQHATLLVTAILNALNAPASKNRSKNQRQSNQNETIRFLTIADLLIQLPGCQLE